MSESTPERRPARRIGAKQRRGFASMSPEIQRQIASAGGKASHAAGTGHRWTKEQASEAGRKGGAVSKRGKAKPTDNR